MYLIGAAQADGAAAFTNKRDSMEHAENKMLKIDHIWAHLAKQIPVQTFTFTNYITEHDYMNTHLLFLT